MQHRLRRLFLMLAVLVALGESTARADLVNFSYHWSIQDSFTPSTVVPSGTGSVQFALAGDGASSFQMGAAMPTTISAATLTTTSTAVAGSADTYNAPYSLKLALTDASGTGSVTFAGTLSGSLTSTTTTLTSTFSTPQTASLLLGSHVYEVTIDPTMLNLPAPGVDANALIDAFVRVKNINGGDGSTGTGGTGTGGTGTGGTTTPSENAPEPSSLILGGIAVCGLAARRWSRTRRAQV